MDERDVFRNHLNNIVAPIRMFWKLRQAEHNLKTFVSATF